MVFELLEACSGNVLLLHFPTFRLRQSAGIAGEHLRRVLVAAELPLQPRGRDPGEFAAVRLAVGAAVTDIEIRREDGHMVDAPDVVHAVLVGDVLLAPEQVERRRAQLGEMLLRQFRHSAPAGTGVRQNAAVADHRGRNPRIRRDLEGLQSSAGHSRHGDLVRVELAIVLARLVGVLRDGPVDRVRQQGRLRRTTRTAALPLTAPMTNPGVVDLPKVGQALNQHQVPPVVLTVKLNNKIEFDNKAMARDELLLAIRQTLQKSPERAVVVAADKNVKYDDVIGVMDLLKQNKVEKVGLLLAPAP